MRTPTTVFDGSRCLLLPNPADGPAVLLVGPGDALTPALFARYGSLVEQPASLDVTPFHLYIVQPAGAPLAGGANLTFANELRSLDGRLQRIDASNGTYLTAWWSILKSEPAAYRTTYTYTFSASLSGGAAQAIQSQCVLTAVRAGDELVVAFPIHANIGTPPTASVAAQFFSDRPSDLGLGPIRLETIINERVQHSVLQTASGGQRIMLGGT
jgi:hypothetical protein